MCRAIMLYLNKTGENMYELIVTLEDQGSFPAMKFRSELEAQDKKFRLLEQYNSVGINADITIRRES